MINSVAYAASDTRVLIVMDDGTTWSEDAALPPDTDIRRQLAGWLAAGGVIGPYQPQEPTIEEQEAAIEAAFAEKKAALVDLLQTVTLFDGATEATRTAAIRAAYAQAVADRSTAIEALYE